MNDAPRTGSRSRLTRARRKPRRRKAAPVINRGAEPDMSDDEFDALVATSLRALAGPSRARIVRTFLGYLADQRSAAEAVAAIEMLAALGVGL